jgi:hypothetical protein
MPMMAILFTAPARDPAAISIGGIARDRRITRRHAADFVAAELVHGLRLGAVLVTAAGTAKPFCTRAFLGTHERLLE